MKLDDIVGPRKQLDEAYKQPAKSKQGKMPDVYQDALPGAVFTTDRFYDLYRMAMIAARLPEDPADIDIYSWIGMSPYVGGYCEEEIEIAKNALKIMGADVGKHIERTGSREPEGVNTQSAIQPFKGYKGTNRRSK